MDEIDTDAYDELCREFTDIFEEEEGKCPPEYNLLQASIMKENWKLATFWYATALRSPTCMHAVFYDRIQRPYSEEDTEDTKFFIFLYKYWGREAIKFIRSKVDDKRAYDERLQEEFQETVSTGKCLKCPVHMDENVHDIQMYIHLASNEDVQKVA